MRQEDSTVRGYNGAKARFNKAIQLVREANSLFNVGGSRYTRLAKAKAELEQAFRDTFGEEPKEAQ